MKLTSRYDFTCWNMWLLLSCTLLQFVTLFHQSMKDLHWSATLRCWSSSRNVEHVMGLYIIILYIYIHDYIYILWYIHTILYIITIYYIHYIYNTLYMMAPLGLLHRSAWFAVTWLAWFAWAGGILMGWYEWYINGTLMGIMIGIINGILMG